MKTFKVRLLALCGLVVLTAASLAPILVEAACPTVYPDCGSGRFRSCKPISQTAETCTYNQDCLNCRPITYTD